MVVDGVDDVDGAKMYRVSHPSCHPPKKQNPRQCLGNVWARHGVKSRRIPPMSGTLFFWGVARRMRHLVDDVDDVDEGLLTRPTLLLTIDEPFIWHLSLLLVLLEFPLPCLLPGLVRRVHELPPLGRAGRPLAHLGGQEGGLWKTQVNFVTMSTEINHK